MKRAIKYFLFFIVCTITFVSCAKDEPAPEEPVPNDPIKTDPPYFRWSTSAGGLTESDSSHAYVNSNVIFAFKNGNSHSIEVRLSGMQAGTYQLSSATGNELDYFINNTLYQGTGTFIISESVSNKMSGNFSCSLTGGTLTALSGTFLSIPKRYN
jgi:hypothetical protein